MGWIWEALGGQERQKVDQERESGGHGRVEEARVVTRRKSEKKRSRRQVPGVGGGGSPGLKGGTPPGDWPGECLLPGLHFF